MSSEQSIESTFGNRLRVRGSAIIVKDEAILLVCHKGLGGGCFWSPPGGGVKFEEHLKNCIIRETKEETGLDISVQNFMFLYEFMQTPLHAVEIFFKANIENGELKKGSDPELSFEKQIIESVDFIPFDELIKMNKILIHPVLHNVQNESELSRKYGLITI